MSQPETRPILQLLDENLLGAREDVRVSSSASCAVYSRTIYDTILRDDEEDPRCRYIYDHTRCSKVDGWRQFDHPSDAWYFGRWFHPQRLVIVQFAEGDEDITVYATIDAFVAEIERLYALTEPVPYMKGLNVSTGEVTEFYDERLTGEQLREIYAAGAT